MPLVYIHGIGNRSGDRYDAAVADRDALFRRFVLPVIGAVPGRARILSPNWGARCLPASWECVSFPTAEDETLGSADDLVDLLPYALPQPPSGGEAVLVGIASESMKDAVDLLYTVLPGGGSDAGMLDFATQAVSFCDYHEALRPRAQERVRYPWLAEVQEDVAFVDRFCAEVMAWSAERSGASDAGVEYLGGPGAVRDRLAQGVGRLRASCVAKLTQPLADGLRRLLGTRVSLLFSDVATYLAQRGTVEQPGPVVALIAETLAEAAAAADAEPVVVVAHSMGGNIVYDLLTHYRTDLKVDVLVTVGSQVGFFEELKLFRQSRGDVPGPATAKLPRPANVRHWINVVDRSDILAYRAGGVFDGVEDYVYPSGAGWAHSAYLRQPNFHARLAGRLRAVLA